MTAFKNFDAVSICCLNLTRSMNLRKSRFGSKSKRNSSCKDVKSSVQKGKPPKSTKCPSKSSLKTPAKHEKPVLDDILITSSQYLKLVTSTPISHEVRKRISRSSNEKAKLKSFSRISYPITSSPIQKAPVQTKSCEIRLNPVRLRGEKYSSETNVDQILKNNKKPSNDQSSVLLNSSNEISYKSAQSRRSSMTLRSHNASKKMPNDAKMTVSKKNMPATKVSTTQKHLSNSQKSVEKPKKNLQPGNKYCTRELSICIEKLPLTFSVFKNKNSVPDKFNEVLISKRNPDEVSQKSQGSLLESYQEIDSSKTPRSRFKKSAVPQERSYSKKKVKNKKKFSTSSKNLVSSSTSENFISDLNRVSRRNSISHNVELSQHSQVSCLSESNNEIENSQSSQYSLRLKNQHLSKRASGSGLSSETSLKSQKVTKTPKSLLESRTDDGKRSRYSLRLEEVQSSKESTPNKLSNHSPKKTSINKQKLVKKNYQDKISKSSKKISNSSKKQSSSKKSTDKFQQDYLNFSENIPIDDLALTFKSPERRKAKSDGFKVPGKHTLKRKRIAIETIVKADEDYEDDLYESKAFDQFKELLMDTSDSERSFSISTPKFPVTPLIRQKTPKYRDCFSPGDYQVSRKAAMEYMYRNKKRKSGQELSETPVIAEKKKLELDYSQVIEDAQKLQKTIESLAEEESDNDSYFSFN